MTRVLQKLHDVKGSYIISFRNISNIREKEELARLFTYKTVHSVKHFNTEVNH